jgi:hypothetical protein
VILFYLIVIKNIPAISKIIPTIMKNDADQCDQQLPKKKQINKSPAGKITVSSKTVSTDSEYDYIQQIGFILDFFCGILKKRILVIFFVHQKVSELKFFIENLVVAQRRIFE